MQHVREAITLHSMILILNKIEAAIILRICRNAISRPLACFAIRVITESGLLYTLMTMATFCAMIVSPDSGLWITHAIVCR